MAYRILIADDEPLIREGIQKIIPWEKLGCEVIGVASNGVMALELAKQKKPDIIISDVKMPKMDGLDLLRSVRKLLPEVEFIIISGYDDFKFAQAAIHAHACAYLLKPLVPEDLVALIAELTQKFEGAVQNQKPVSRQQLIRNLIDQTFVDEDNYTYAELIAQEADAYYTAMAVSINDFPMLSNLLSTQKLISGVKSFKCLVNHLEEFENVTAFASSQEIICCVLVQSSVQKLQALLHSTIGQIRSWLTERNCYPCSIGVGKSYRGILRVQSSYLEALRALQSRYLFQNAEVVYFKDIGQTMVLPHSSVQFDETALIRHVERGEKDKIIESIHKTFSHGAGQASYVDLLITARSLLYRCTQLMQDYDLEISQAFPDLCEKAHTVFLTPDLEELSAVLCEILCHTADAIQNSQYGNMDAIILKAIKYMEDHYCDSTLNLNAVSKHISFNSSYFSNIFSTRVGKSFIDYLTELRIKKACELLANTQIKISTISQMVGYRSQNYFSTRFREVTGAAPSQYRRETCEP